MKKLIFLTVILGIFLSISIQSQTVTYSVTFKDDAYMPGYPYGNYDYSVWVGMVSFDGTYDWGPNQIYYTGIPAYWYPGAILPGTSYTFSWIAPSPEPRNFAYMYAIVRKYVHGTQTVVATRTGQTDWIGWSGTALDFGTIKVTEF